MLTNDEFQALATRLAFKQQTINRISVIRTSPPSRRVTSFSGNVCGSYPSRKMKRALPFESHKVELASIYELEHDPEVLEYYPQPEGQLHLEYQKNARKVVAFHTPDFFIIKNSGAGWRECKSAERLLQLFADNPGRYCQAANGEWMCPPGMAAAGELGLDYELHTSAKINWKEIRNIKFLEDYLRSDDFIVDESDRRKIIAAVGDNPGIRLLDLLQTVESSDSVYRMIIVEDIYVDLSQFILAEPALVPVFANRSAASAWKQLSRVEEQLLTFDFKTGTTLEWCGKAWTIVNFGESEVFVSHSETNSLMPMRLNDFRQLTATGKIRPLAVPKPDGSVPDAILNVYRKASERDLKIANQRQEILGCYQRHEQHDDMPHIRTIGRWLARYKEAELLHGCGYLGLLPEYSKSGNYGSKLSLKVQEIIDEQIRNNYETLKQKRMIEVHGEVLLICDQHGLTGPSYKAFARYVHLMNNHKQTAKRQGNRAAYSREPIYMELTMTTPRHGDRPFEVCHIDHTQLDIELRCSLTGKNLGRPWLTILTDAFSRRFLAIHLTYDPPSYRSCMMVLRDCVRRHGRLPQFIVVDNGAEFHSIYFEALLARYECTRKFRPPHKAKFGSVCERLFGTTNTRFLYNLAGNTQIMKRIRQVYKNINPKEFAGWTLEALFEAVDEFAFEVNDMIVHPALGISPRDAFLLGMRTGGQRSCRIIPYDANFLLWTMPTTSKKSAKVIASRGVRVNHLYYWNAVFVQPDVEGSQVAVRYDPYDAGVVWCYVNKTWVTCQSEFFTTFQGRTEREMRYATIELKKRLKTSAGESAVTARRLASFIRTLEAKEEFLIFKLREAANRYVIASITGRGFGADLENRAAVITPPFPITLSLPQPTESENDTTKDSETVPTDETFEIYEEM